MTVPYKKTGQASRQKMTIKNKQTKVKGGVAGNHNHMRRVVYSSCPPYVKMYLKAEPNHFTRTMRYTGYPQSHEERMPPGEVIKSYAP